MLICPSRGTEPYQARIARSKRVVLSLAPEPAQNRGSAGKGHGLAGQVAMGRPKGGLRKALTKLLAREPMAVLREVFGIPLTPG